MLLQKVTHTLEKEGPAQIVTTVDETANRVKSLRTSTLPGPFGGVVVEDRGIFTPDTKATRKTVTTPLSVITVTHVETDGVVLHAEQSKPTALAMLLLEMEAAGQELVPGGYMPEAAAERYAAQAEMASLLESLTRGLRVYPPAPEDYDDLPYEGDEGEPDYSTDEPGNVSTLKLNYNQPPIPLQDRFTRPVEACSCNACLQSRQDIDCGDGEDDAYKMN